jgi:hypothetical protein
MDISIFSSFLPEGLLFHFDIVELKELGDLETKKIAFISIKTRKTFSQKNIATLNMNQKGFMNEP